MNSQPSNEPGHASAARPQHRTQPAHYRQVESVVHLVPQRSSSSATSRGGVVIDRRHHASERHRLLGWWYPGLGFDVLLVVQLEHRPAIETVRGYI